jgi:signal transduction histidine kinase
MSVQFHELARQARGLLQCDMAALVLGCSERGLRHPLLDSLDVGDYRLAGRDGPGDERALLAHEHVRALCDLSLQSGQWQSLSLLVDMYERRDIAALPLERPAGILGLLVCASTREQRFSSGEQQLLQQYAPVIARRLEQDLACAYVVPGAPDGSPREESASAQYEFISLVSHEVRAPLAAIKGYAALLQAYGSAAEEAEHAPDDAAVMSSALQRAYLAHIIEQTRYLEVLMNDLLDVSRLHAGQLALHPTSVNAALLCQRVTWLMQDRVEQRHPGRYTLRCVLPPDAPPLRADPDRVQQVLTNLIDNAVKYSPGGGMIEVIVAVPSCDAMSITVRDRGLGIPAARQGQLFRPFSRLHSASAPDIRGAGLGLYACRKLIEAMRGSIALSSQEGEGTSVSVTLPIA